MEVSELCRREGIHPAQYYGRKKQLVGSAGDIFGPGRCQPTAQEQRLRQEM